ncbi:hypothetical protein [Ferrimonas marina]|uniref:Uncharacterized protein n=1 Tax=Ferrimonas marina TaxID=299255 RepID=A0A1M5TX72_9GAMM|nr:hypothetical protein [Ferrimonas marina]SHH55206.1 hypothetical protein SAMN02745129_2309 [Ferrimonas marina]
MTTVTNDELHHIAQSASISVHTLLKWRQHRPEYLGLLRLGIHQSLQMPVDWEQQWTTGTTLDVRSLATTLGLPDPLAINVLPVPSSTVRSWMKDPTRHRRLAMMLLGLQQKTLEQCQSALGRKTHLPTILHQAAMGTADLVQLYLSKPDALIRLLRLAAT